MEKGQENEKKNKPENEVKCSSDKIEFESFKSHSGIFNFSKDLKFSSDPSLVVWKRGSI